MPAGIRLFNYAKCALSKFASKAPVLSVPFKLPTGYFAEMTEALTSTNPVIAIIHVRIVICQAFDTKNPPKRALSLVFCWFIRLNLVHLNIHLIYIQAFGLI